MLAAILERCPLSVQGAQLGMKPLANDPPIAHNHSSDERIRADSPPPELCKLQRSPQMGSIRACELGFHETD